MTAQQIIDAIEAAFQFGHNLKVSRNGDGSDGKLRLQIKRRLEPNVARLLLKTQRGHGAAPNAREVQAAADLLDVVCDPDETITSWLCRLMDMRGDDRVKFWASYPVIREPSSVGGALVVCVIVSKAVRAKLLEGT